MSFDGGIQSAGIFDQQQKQKLKRLARSWQRNDIYDTRQQSCRQTERGSVASGSVPPLLPLCRAAYTTSI